MTRTTTTCKGSFVCAVVVCLSCVSDVRAQVRPEPAVTLSNSIDEVAVTRYLDTIDEEIGQIAKDACPDNHPRERQA